MSQPGRPGGAQADCIFCSAKGSGDFAGPAAMPISGQLARGKLQLMSKRPVHSYIAYFQAFTIRMRLWNTSKKFSWRRFPIRM